MLPRPLFGSFAGVLADLLRPALPDACRRRRASRRDGDAGRLGSARRPPARHGRARLPDHVGRNAVLPGARRPHHRGRCRPVPAERCVPLRPQLRDSLRGQRGRAAEELTKRPGEPAPQLVGSQGRQPDGRHGGVDSAVEGLPVVQERAVPVPHHVPNHEQARLGSTSLARAPTGTVRRSQRRGCHPAPGPFSRCRPRSRWRR